MFWFRIVCFPFFQKSTLKIDKRNKWKKLSLFKLKKNNFRNISKILASFIVNGVKRINKSSISNSRKASASAAPGAVASVARVGKKLVSTVSDAGIPTCGRLHFIVASWSRRRWKTSSFWAVVVAPLAAFVLKLCPVFFPSSLECVGRSAEGYCFLAALNIRGQIIREEKTFALDSAFGREAKSAVWCCLVKAHLLWKWVLLFFRLWKCCSKFGFRFSFILSHRIKAPYAMVN